MNFPSRFVVCTLLLITFGLQAQHYLYPIGVYGAKKNKVMLLEQDGIEDLSIWEWDITSKKAHTLLTSWCQPALVALLPDGSGFSFIDNGLIRVKKFHKRSPKTLNVSEPLFMIRSLVWLDNERCYFSARQHEQFGHRIYLTDMSGELEVLVSDGSNDCLYPQVRDDQLFYLHRTAQEKRYSICVVPFSVHEPTQQHQKVQQLVSLDGLEEQLGFLRMINGQNGFLLGYKEDGQMILFSCYLLQKQTLGSWKQALLFSFKVPKNMLFGSSADRLYESALPFVPQLGGDGRWVSYIDYANSTGGSQLCIYDFATRKVYRKKRTQFSGAGRRKKQLLVGTLSIGDTVFGGGALSSRGSHTGARGSVAMRSKKNGSVFITLPHVTYSPKTI